MTVRGYVLIGAAVGTFTAVATAVAQLRCPGARVLSVDAVTGPVDVIVYLEADDLEALVACLSEGIRRIDGVEDTMTCLAIGRGSA